MNNFFPYLQIHNIILELDILWILTIAYRADLSKNSNKAVNTKKTKSSLPQNLDRICRVDLWKKGRLKTLRSCPFNRIVAPVEYG